MDYLGYWSLKQRPFTEPGAGAPFFAGQPQREVFAGLNYFMASDARVAHLMAAPRCGMTRLMRQVQELRGLGDHATEILRTANIRDHRGAIETAFCDALGLRCNGQDTSARIVQALRVSGDQGIGIVWMIDDCDRKTVWDARRFADQHESLSIVVGVKSESEKPIVFSPCADDLVIHLEPFSLADTLGYVRHGLRHAGCERQLFTDAAAVRMHELSGGRLADLAAMSEASLVLAASHRMDQVSPAVVEAISQQKVAQAA